MRRYLVVLVLLAGCRAQERPARELPDRRLTPGATVEVSLETMCTYGYTRTVRDVPLSEKRAVYREYGVVYEPGQYEVDHLVSLDIGGSNSIRNLWPQPRFGYWNSSKKDALEAKLGKMVCAGEMPLAEAQQRIASNWITFYDDVFGR